MNHLLMNQIEDEPLLDYTKLNFMDKYIIIPIKTQET